MTSGGDDSGARPRTATWLVGATVLLASLCLSHTHNGWNVNTRLGLVFAVVDHGTFSIDEYHNAPLTQTGDKAYFDGHFYSDKTIGLSLVAIPAYAAIRVGEQITGHQLGFHSVQYLLTRWSVSVPAAIAAMLMVALMLQLGASQRRTVLCVAGVFFGSMLFGYSTIFAPYLPGIACCLGALLLILRGPFTWKRCAAIGTLLGWAVLFDLTFIAVVIIIGAFAVPPLRQLGRRTGLTMTAVILATAAIPLIVFAVYCTIIFGTPTIPYRYEYSDFFREAMGEGVMGATLPKVVPLWYLTAHPFRGLFFWSPWVAVALASAVSKLRRGSPDRPFAAAAIAAFVVYLVFNAGYYLWWGGGAMGPRLMLPMFALLPLALAGPCRDGASTTWWRVLLATLAIGVALSLPVGMVDPQTPTELSDQEMMVVGLADNLHPPQFDDLAGIYSLDWADTPEEGGANTALRYAACLAVIAVGTVAAWRAASGRSGWFRVAARATRRGRL